MKTIFITGGAGFIGSALIRYIIKYTDCVVVNLDKLTYAGNLASLENESKSSRYHFEQVDICDSGRISQLFANINRMRLCTLQRRATSIARLADRRRLCKPILSVLIRYWKQVVDIGQICP